MSEHWASDPDRLLLATPAMDGDTRDIAKRARMADNQRIRAYQAGTNLRRPWEAGDPGRRGKPWRPFCRELWEQGREDARLWKLEQQMAEMHAQAERALRQAAREQRRMERLQAKRRKARANRVYRIVRPFGPRTARRLRRWLS
jgi:multidrug efflux pump subunit AcrA (membrane-fusion protein)